MGWTVRGSNPDGARIFTPIQTGPGVQPTSYTVGSWSFPGVKRPGNGTDYPSLSSAEDEGTVELYLFPPLGLRCLFRGAFYLHLLPFIVDSIVLMDIAHISCE